VIYLERLGTDPAEVYDEDAFDLVKLFAAQASIALQNAELYHDIEVRAQTDGLTGLMNHSTFQESLTQAIKRGERFSLIYVDLDNFGAYNKIEPDFHLLGDRLLRAIAHGLQRAGREADRVFRYGGDEFTLLLPGTDSDGAQAVARKVARAISRVTAQEETLSVPISASIGVATFPEDGTDREEILLTADRAASVAKRMGGSRVVTAQEGRAITGVSELTVPTPVDSEPLRPGPGILAEAAASIGG